MNFQDVFNDILHNLNHEMDLDIRVKASRRGSVFPQVDVATGGIAFNTKLRAFVALYNYMSFYPDTGCDYVSLYTLYNMYIEQNDYDNADEVLTLLSAKIKNLPPVDNDNLPLIVHSVDLQMLLIILHECAHRLFHVYGDVRSNAIANVRQSIEEMKIDEAVIYSKIQDYVKGFCSPVFSEDFADELMQQYSGKMQQISSQLFNYSAFLDPNNDNMVEELCCDQMACGLIMPYYIQDTTSDEAFVEAATEMLMSLFIMDYDHCFHTIFAGVSDSDMINLPRVYTVRHANLREYLFNFFYAYRNRDVARRFLREAELRDDRCKRLMLPSVVNNIYAMMTLQHTVKAKPQKSRAMELESRFAEVERDILVLTNCQHTSQSI